MWSMSPRSSWTTLKVHAWKRTQGSGYWVSAGTGNPGFLYSGPWTTWGPIMNVRIIKHLATLKGFEMCANEKQIQNPTGNASTVSLVALAYVTLHDLTTAWNTWAKIEEDCTLWQQCFYCTWKTFCSYRNTMFYYWKHRLNIFFITPQHVSIKLVSLWIIQL